MEHFRFDPNSTINEGRYRLKCPKEFKRFWRKQDNKEKGIGYIVGILKNGKYATQAVRFNKDSWTETQAAKWWKQNKHRFYRSWVHADWERI